MIVEKRLAHADLLVRKLVRFTSVGLSCCGIHGDTAIERAVQRSLHRSRPQHCEQISPPIAGHCRRGRRVLHILHSMVGVALIVQYVQLSTMTRACVQPIIGL